MVQPDRKPTSFLSLSRELRQRILSMTITEKYFQQDVKFNVSLHVYDNTIMANVLSHTSGTRTRTRSPGAPAHKLDKEAFENFHGANTKLKSSGIIPAHIVKHAETLAAVHPMVKEDMSWVLKKWLEKLFELLSEAEYVVPRTSRRRQSIYVPEPFGTRRRVDKFTPEGLRSHEATKRGLLKAYARSKEVWVFDG